MTAGMIAAAAGGKSPGKRGQLSPRRLRRLVLEHLEQRVLLNAATPYKPSNPDGYLELGNLVRFQMIESGHPWQITDGKYLTDVPIRIGGVPQQASPFIPLLEADRGLEIDRNSNEFRFTAEPGRINNINYTPEGKNPPWAHNLFAVQQNTDWVDIRDFTGETGATIDGTAVNSGETKGVAVAPGRGTLFPDWMRLDLSDPYDPLLLMRGALKINIPSKFVNAKVLKVVDGLNLRFGSNGEYSVQADKNQATQIVAENEEGGIWVSVSTPDFNFGGLHVQVEELEFAYHTLDSSFGILGKFKMSWGNNALFLDLGTDRDHPGFVIKDWELDEFSATIGISHDGQSSELHAGGTKFTISNAGLRWAKSAHTLGIYGEVDWDLGDQKGFSVVLGEPTDPGLLIHDGELLHFDAQVTAGQLHVKEIPFELHNVHFVYDRYAHEEPSGSLFPVPEIVGGDDIEFEDIADQFWHPDDNIDALDVVFSGAGEVYEVSAESSDQGWLSNNAITVVAGDQPGVYELNIDADPDEPGDQAPTERGTATITVTVSAENGQNQTTFDVTVGEEQIEYSGIAFINLGNGPKFEVGVDSEAPWIWSYDGYEWDWHIGSLIIGITGSFRLGPVDIEAQNLQIEFTDEKDGSKWEVSGGAAVPTFWNASVMLGTADQPGIVIEDGKWQVHDLQVSLAPPYRGGWGLQDLKFHYSQGQDDHITMLVDGALSFPGGFAIGASFDVEDGELQMIALSYEAGTNEGIPVGDTGVFITGMKGEVDNISEGDLTFAGDLSFSTGPSVETKGKRLGFITGDGDFRVSGKGMEVDVEVAFAGGLYGSAEGKMILDWQADDYSIDISGQLWNHTFEFDIWAELHHSDLTLGGKADVRIPKFIPYIGGRELAEVDFLLELTEHEKLAAAWAHIDLGKINLWGGIEYDITHEKFHFIGHDTIKKLQGDMPDPGNHVYKVINAFKVPDDPVTANGMSFDATWDHPDDSVRVYLFPPEWNQPVLIRDDMDGTTISQDGKPSYRVWTIDDATTPTSLAFQVRPVDWSADDPDHLMNAGDYNVAVMSHVEVWPDIQGHILQPRPTLDVSLDVTGRNAASVDYAWRSASPAKSTVTFYCDDDAFGYNGIKLATVSPLDVPPDHDYFEKVDSTWAWGDESLESLQHIPYHVYAVIDDGTGIPVYSNYSSDTITPEPPLVVDVDVHRGTEADLSGWTVRVLDPYGNLADTVDGFPAHRQTNSRGEAAFNLAAGDYTVVMARPSALFTAAPRQGQSVDGNGNLVQPISISDPDSSTAQPAFAFTKRSEIEGRIILDSNANGMRDGTDLPLDGWQVYLDMNDNGSADAGEPTAESDHEGVYNFYVDPPSVGKTDSYIVRQAPLPPDYDVVEPGQGALHVELATPPDGASPSSFSNDFLNAWVVGISGLVFSDLNADGQQDPGEPGLAGLTVTAKPEGGDPLTATTDANGRYFIKSELVVGGSDFTVTVDAPSGATETWPVSHIFDFGAKTPSDMAEFHGTSPTEGWLTTMAMADYTGDGNDDLVHMQPFYGGTILRNFVWDNDNRVYHDVHDSFYVMNGTFVDPQIESLNGTDTMMVSPDAGGLLWLWTWDNGQNEWQRLGPVYDGLQDEGRARVAILDLDRDGDKDIFDNDGYGWIYDGNEYVTRTSQRIVPEFSETLSSATLVLPVAGNIFGTRLSQDLALAYGDDSGQVFVTTYRKVAPSVVSYDKVQQVQVSGQWPQQMTGGDLDGDGDMDLVVASRAGSSGDWHVYVDILMNEDGRLNVVDSRRFDGKDHISSLRIADMDGNGLQDVCWAFKGEVDVLLNHGRGYFVLAQRSDYLPSGAQEAAHDYPTTGAARIADRATPLVTVVYIVDGDSFEKPKDQVYATVYEPDIALEYQYEAYFNEPGIYSGYDFGLHGANAPADGAIYGSVFEDTNGNGIQDLNERPEAGVQVRLLNADDGSLVATAETNALGDYRFTAPLAGSYHIELTDDSEQSSPLATVFSLGDADAAPAVTDPVAWTTADVNGDGLADRVLVQNDYLITRLSSTSGSATLAVTTLPEPIQPHQDELLSTQWYVDTGDVNGDGRVDVVAAYANSVSGSGIMVLHGAADGTFQMAQHSVGADLNAPGVEMAPPRLADVNADGLLDLWWFTDPSENVLLAFMHNAGDGTFQPAVGTALQLQGVCYSTPDPTDLNGDSVVDFIVTDESTVLFYRGYGIGQFEHYASATLNGYPGGTQSRILDPNWNHTLQVSDLDRDGFPDVLAVTDHGLQVLWNEGGFVFTHQTLVHPDGLPGDMDDHVAMATVARNVNGDELPDVAVVYTDGSRTAMTILMNEGAGKFAAPLAAIDVVPPDYAAVFEAADLNGDGFGEIMLAPISRATAGRDLQTNIWPNESWVKDFYAIGYSTGQNVGGYDFGLRPPAAEQAAIRGAVFSDRDSDKHWGLAEDGLLGITVFLDTNRNNQLDKGERWRATDEGGLFEFDGLNPGSYTVQAVVPSDYTLTTSAPITVPTTAGKTVHDVFFGFHPEFTINDPPVAGWGYGLQLDGDDDLVEVPVTFNTLDAWTFSAWARPDELKDGFLYSEGNPLETLRIELTHDGRVTVGAWNEDEPGNWKNFSTPSGLIAEDEWNFVAVRLTDGDVGKGTVSVFVNGQRYVGALQTEHHPHTTYAAIGANIGGLHGGDQGLSAFDGWLDEVRTWSVALTDDEIAQHQYTTLAGNEHGLAGYWRLDEAAGYKAVNSASGDTGIGGAGMFRGNPRRRASTAPVNTYTVEGHAVEGKLFGTDPDGDHLSFVLAEGAAHGQVDINPTTADFTYTPDDSNWNGTDAFTAFANDGHSWSRLPYEFSVVVRSQNQPPVAVDDHVRTVAPVSVPIHVLDNDSDYHGGEPGENNVPLAVYDYSTGVTGLTFHEDGQYFTYTSHLAPADYTVNFSYRTVDTLGAVSESANVTIDVKVIRPFGSGDVCQFRDRDGTLVRMHMVNGSANLHFNGEGLHYEQRGRWTFVSGEGVGLAEVELTESNEFTRIVIAAAGGDDHLVTIGGISGGSAGWIIAPRVVLGGEGLQLDGDLRYARFHAVQDVEVDVRGDLQRIIVDTLDNGSINVAGDVSHYVWLRNARRSAVHVRGDMRQAWVHTFEDSALNVSGSVLRHVSIYRAFSGSHVAVGVSAGEDDRFFTDDDYVVSRDSVLNRIYIRSYEPGNSGEPFGILTNLVNKDARAPVAVGRHRLSLGDLWEPWTDGDMRIRVL